MIRRAFKFLLFASALGVGALLACTAFTETVDGSGNPATEDRAVGPVTEVALSGIGNLTVVQGDVPGLSVTADDNILPLLETETSGRKLTIRTKTGFSIHPSGPINYTLTVPKLEKVSVSGSGNVMAERLTGDNLTIKLSGSGSASLREVACKELTLTISGSGTTSMSGTADKVTTKISGSGDIDAAGLKVKTAEVQVSGSGTASVWATDELNVRVSGSGDVKYKGTPKIEQKVSGSGKVKSVGG
jgi:Putative auto-transporter adhesin, head GIN domain